MRENFYFKNTVAAFAYNARLNFNVNIASFLSDLYYSFNYLRYENKFTRISLLDNDKLIHQKLIIKYESSDI